MRAPVSLLVSSSPAFVLPALFVAVAWWLAMRGDAWVNVHSREISASFIARFHWSDVGWLFRALPWVSLWLRGWWRVGALVWAPWTQLVPWHPRSVTPGATELAVVGLKLGIVAVLSALGWSLVARTAAVSRTRM